MDYDFIKQLEGFTPNAQWDYRQFSNGYGTKALHPGETIDQAEADRRLQAETIPLESWVNQNIPNATPGQRQGLVSFGYNLGQGALDKLLPDIRSGDWSRVAQRMQSFNKAGGEVNNGLVSRRAKEGELVLGAPLPGNSTPTPTGANSGTPMDIGTALASQGVSNANPVPGALDLGPLPSESKKALAQALMSNAFQRSGNLGGGWLGPISALAQIYAGSKIAGNYEQQANDRQKKLAQALMGAQGNDELTRTLLASGDPDLIKAAVTSRLGAAQRGLTPVPMYDDQGNLVYGTVGHTGDWSPLQTPKGASFKPAPKATTRIVGNERITTNAFGQEIGREPIDLQAAQREKDAGKLQAVAQSSLPEVERQTNQVLGIIDKLDKDPMRAKFTGYSGYLPTVTPEANTYKSYLDQVKGGAFLQAYNALKGAGAISNYEGQKAEQALTRLSAIAPSDAGYQSALDDARQTFTEILQNARKRASGQLADKPAATPPTAAPAVAAETSPTDQPKAVKTMKFNPQTGEIE